MNLPNQASSIHRIVEHKAVSIALLILCTVLIAATAYRTYKNYSIPSSNFDWSLRGHSDFHNGAYYPSIAFRKGLNPYSPEMMEEYPVASSMRPCPPITFVLHLPFTFFDLKTADILYFAFNVALLFGLAAFCVSICRGQFHVGWWLLVSAALLMSRPGHITLFTGYYTLELVLGSLLALHFGKTRPWLSAVGMLVASAKPTYILPLILVMLARKNFRAVVLGLVLCTIAGIGGLAWLAKDSSFVDVIQGISAGQEAFHADETEFPVNTWTRIDILGMFARFANWIPADKVYLASWLVISLIPCFAIARITNREEDSGATGTSAAIAMLTILVAIYHHSYDSLLVVVPWVGVTFFSSNVLPEVGARSKYLLVVLLAVPMMNYFSTLSARKLLGLEQTDLIWQVTTIINGICLLLSLLIILAATWRSSQSGSEENFVGSEQRA